jgi:hypothetical protein
MTRAGRGDLQNENARPAFANRTLNAARRNSRRDSGETFYGKLAGKF